MSAARGPEPEREPPRTAGEMLARTREFLARKGVPEARLEAELLVAHALGLDRLHLFMDLERPLAPAEVARARELLVRRGKREPAAYLRGEREFYGRAFEVSPAVLIPRPETELVVDAARELCAGRAGLRVGDFGTGSGCLAVTLALELAGSDVAAVDVSTAALAVARRNAERHGASVRFVEGDAPGALAQAFEPGTLLDLLVSNPPYVDPAGRAELEPEVRDHEPGLALFAPAGDPDHWARRLLEEGVELLAAGGLLLVELGLGQGERVAALARERGLAPRLRADLARIPRVLEVRRG